MRRRTHGLFYKINLNIATNQVKDPLVKAYLEGPSYALDPLGK